MHLMVKCRGPDGACLLIDVFGGGRVYTDVHLFGAGTPNLRALRQGRADMSVRDVVTRMCRNVDRIAGVATRFVLNYVQYKLG